MYLSGYKYRMVCDQMEFDPVTNRYLYLDRYIKMIPYFLNVLWTSKCLVSVRKLHALPLSCVMN
jgi:hypothetical protein